MGADPRLFINYRIDDCGWQATALFRELSAEFSPSQIYLDHGSTGLGESWPERLEKEVNSASVGFVMIGNDWLTIQDDGGRRRLDHPDDWVRREIEVLLNRKREEEDVFVVPVLVEDTKIPPAHSLPESIRDLHSLTASSLRRLDFDADVGKLVEFLEYKGFERHGVVEISLDRDSKTFSDRDVDAAIRLICDKLGCSTNGVLILTKRGSVKLFLRIARNRIDSLMRMRGEWEEGLIQSVRSLPRKEAVELLEQSESEFADLESKMLIEVLRQAPMEDWQEVSTYLEDAGLPLGIHGIVAYLLRTNVQISQIVNCAIANAGPMVIYPLVRLASSVAETRHKISAVLTSIGEIGIPFMAGALRDPNPDVRTLMVQVMDNIGGAQANDALRFSAFYDESPAVRMAAVAGIDPTFEPASTFRAVSRDNDPAVRSFAIAALARINLQAEMVVIPAGSFQMGSEDGLMREQPIHTVHIRKPFALGRYAVTFEQYDDYAEATGVSKPDDEGWGRGNRPVINVSWHDAQSYIAWLNKQSGGGYRLPSEAEWEYACRAGTTTEYSWGNEIGINRANCYNSKSQWINQTAPVGSFEPNAFGLYDMHGNVWEWVQDCYEHRYDNAPNDGSAYESGDCRSRVLRGGSWLSGPLYLRSAFRFYYGPTVRDDNFFGFRLAQDL